MKNSTLLAGAAMADITPAVGGKLYGYNDWTVSTSLHDPLDLRALALGNADETPFLMVSVAVGDYGTETCTETRRAIAAACDIPMERIALSAIHTHSGPNVCGVAGWGGVDRPYLDGILIPAAVRAAKEAVASMRPAEFAAADGESLVGVNRRELTEDAEIVFGQNLWAPQDKTMTVIRFRDAETKKGIFQLVHYGCHGTAAGNNKEISRDWIGVMEDRLTNETGILSGFWNGCVGDVGPRVTNGKTTADIFHAEELGGVAAQDAIRIANGFRSAVWETGELRFSDEPITIPVRPIPAKEAVDDYLSAHPAGEYSNIEGLIDDYMRKAADCYESGVFPPKEKPVPVQTVRVGDAFAFCFTPYELFSEICLRIRRDAPVRHALAVSLTNGYEAYLPTRDALPRGGYEVACFLHGSIAALCDDADTYLVKGFLKILREM